jgi:hypothetical protein
MRENPTWISEHRTVVDHYNRAFECRTPANTNAVFYAAGSQQPDSFVLNDYGDIRSEGVDWRARRCML